MRAHRCHACDNPEHHGYGWIEMRQWSCEIKCQFESTKGDLYRLQVIDTSSECRLLGCMLIAILKCFEQLFHIFALKNSNVQVFAEAIDRLAKCSAP